MSKIVIVDTYYPDFLAALPPIAPGSIYPVELRRVLDLGFGTSDFYSHHLSRLGWECLDVIANYPDLQRLWLSGHGKWTNFGNDQAIVLEQIQREKPDVLFFQDLSFFDPATLESLRRDYLLAGQCSCPMPSRDRVVKFDVLFTSFPHYVDAFQKAGVRAFYLPLAFDERMIPPSVDRDIEISFVGGARQMATHWTRGTNMLEEVAHQLGGRFRWFGYGQTDPGLSAALRACWVGPAWGREMYGIYSRSKIVINRHGEVAAGFANNLRMFEATGVGAMLMTEEAPNLSGLFPPGSVATYAGGSDLCERIRFFLDRPERLAEIAIAGQAVTMTEHTYSIRMEAVSGVLAAALAARGVAR